MGTITDSLGLMNNFEGIRIVDASIMPDMISGNLNATVIMMAEKISWEMNKTPLVEK